MKAGISFANSGAFSRPDLFAQLARDAEELGFESIWTVEHVIIPQPHMPYPGSKDGQMPGGDHVAIPDPLIPLAYAAAITSKIKLATGIVILPQRHPLYLAKQLASLDVLSQGRVILGIGSGWMPEEFASVDVDFKTRGARTDESIQAMRALWSDTPASFHGKYYHFHDVKSLPKPVNSGECRSMSEVIRRPRRSEPGATATASFRRSCNRTSSRKSLRRSIRKRPRSDAIRRPLS